MKARFWILLLVGLPLAGALGYLAAERAAPPAAAQARTATAPQSVTAPQPGVPVPEHREAVPAPHGPTSAQTARAEFEAALSDRSDGASDRLRLAYVHWLLEDPAAALARADELPAGERHEVVAAGLTLFAHERPDQALRYLSTLDGDYTPYLAGALGEVAKTDARRALEWVEQNQARDPNGDLYGAVIPALAKVDLSRAAHAVESLGERAPENAFQAVAAEYARRDPARAYTWASEMAAARHDDPAASLRAVSTAVVTADPAGAAQLLSRTADPAVRASLIGEISQQRGEKDLPGAWQWLGQFKDDPSYDANARELLSRWSYTKPQDVANLLPAVADPELQASAAKQLAGIWQQQDPVRYGAWVGSLPAGPIKSAATSAAAP